MESLSEDSYMTVLNLLKDPEYSHGSYRTVSYFHNALPPPPPSPGAPPSPHASTGPYAPLPLPKKGEGEAGYIKGGTTVRFIRTSSTFQLKSSYNLHNKVLYTTFLHQKFGGVKRHHSNCSQSL